MAQCPVRSCEICESYPSNRFCQNCEQFFCNPCEILHMKTKACRNHVFQDGDKANVKVKTPVCVQHEEMFTHYCKTCKTLICYICLPTTHKKHDFCLIEDEAKEARYSLDNDVRTATNRIKSAQKKIDWSYSDLCTFKDQTEKSKKNIEERVAEIVGTFNTTKNAYLMSIDEHKTEESRNFGQNILKMVNATDNCQEALNKMKSSIDEKNDIALLDSFSDMTNTLKSISDISNWTKLPVRVQFDPSPWKPEPEKLIGNISIRDSLVIEIPKYEQSLDEIYANPLY